MEIEYQQSEVEQQIQHMLNQFVQSEHYEDEVIRMKEQYQMIFLKKRST